MIFPQAPPLSVAASTTSGSRSARKPPTRSCKAPAASSEDLPPAARRMKNGQRWMTAMTITLERLDQQSSRP